jgi:hypothetical protein
MIGTHVECVWTTRNPETGRTVGHYKTLRNDDGVCVGEHIEENCDYGRILRRISGNPDMDYTSREDMAVWRQVAQQR